MKKQWILIFVLCLLLAFAMRTQYQRFKLQEQLKQEYPDFLHFADEVIVDKSITALLNTTNQLTEEQLTIFWKLLWIDKDFGTSYLSTKERTIAIKTATRAKVTTLLGFYHQINTLKYKLGINNKKELDTITTHTICDTAPHYLKLVNWNEGWDINIYFDIIHFCQIPLPAEAIKLLQTHLEKETDPIIRQHLIEHGTIDVPVYINEKCNKAKNENERYHCLTFV